MTTLDEDLDDYLMRCASGDEDEDVDIPEYAYQLSHGREE